MLAITTKLKRIRYTRNIIQVILWVLFSPLFLIYFIGKLLTKIELVLGFIFDLYRIVERKAVDYYNLDDVARKQYKENPKKFKD